MRAFEDRVRPGPERLVDLREVVNTILYLNRTGCQGRYLPHDLLPKSTVYDYFAKWRDKGLLKRLVATLREEVRKKTPKAPGQEGMREPTPSAACVDSQTVKTTEMGGTRGRVRTNDYQAVRSLLRKAEYNPTVVCEACGMA